MKKSFSQLSRATQRKHLKELVKQALSRYGILDAEIRYVTDLNNAVFRIISGMDCGYSTLHQRGLGNVDYEAVFGRFIGQPTRDF